MLAVADVALAAGARHVAEPDDRPAAPLGRVELAAVREAEHAAGLLGRLVGEAARTHGAPRALEEHFEPAAMRRAVLQPHRRRARRRARVPRR